MEKLHAIHTNLSNSLTEFDNLYNLLNELKEPTKDTNSLRQRAKTSELVIHKSISQLQSHIKTNSRPNYVQKYKLKLSPDLINDLVDSFLVFSGDLDSSGNTKQKQPDSSQISTLKQMRSDVDNGELVNGCPDLRLRDLHLECVLLKMLAMNKLNEVTELLSNASESLTRKIASKLVSYTNEMFLRDSRMCWSLILTKFWELKGFAYPSQLEKLARGAELMYPCLDKFGDMIEWRGGLPFEVNLPAEFQYHHAFVCPVTKEHYLNGSDLVLLSCGHLISKVAFDDFNDQAICPCCAADQNYELIQFVKLEL